MNTSHVRLRSLSFSCSPSRSDDHGREVRQQHLGPPQERHSGDPEEEQQWPELRGAVQERLHHGAAQTWREAIHRIARSRHRAPHLQSKKVQRRHSLSCMRNGSGCCVQQVCRCCGSAVSAFLDERAIKWTFAQAHFFDSRGCVVKNENEGFFFLVIN